MKFLICLFLLLASTIVYAETVPASDYWYITSKNRGGTDPTVGGPYTTLTCPGGAAASSTADLCFTCNISNSSGCTKPGTKWGSSYCPTNAIYAKYANGLVYCTVPANSVGLYTGTFNQATGVYVGGSWIVVPSAQANASCSAGKVYNSVTRVCDIPVPPPNTNLVGASFLGLAGLVGVGLGIVAFSPIGISLGLATTVTSGLLALGMMGSSDTTTAEKAANVYSPITVELDPTKSLVSPAINNGSAAKINKSSSKTLQPAGGDAKNVWSTAANGKKILTQTGSTGSRVVGEIEADGKTAVIYGSETKPVNTHVQVETDGSALVAHGGFISSRNGSSGAATKVAVIEIHNFNSEGAKVAKNQYSNNVNQDGSSVDHVTIGSGSGGDGSANSCGSINCEATQQIIKNTLVDIKTDLSKQADTTGLQAGMTDGNVNPSTLQSSMMQGAPDTVKNFGSFAVVEHTSECPVLTIPFNGQSYTMDSHCTLADNFRPQMIALMNVVWGFIAFMIVLGA
jgi:hypothetical protein